MAHKVIKMVSSFDTWHGLETRVAKPMKGNELLEKSGIGALQYAMLPIQTPYGDEISEFMALYEMNSRQLVHVHGKDYTPARPDEVVSHFDAVVAELGGNWISGGILDDYKKLWALAEVPSLSFNLGKGDNKVMPYLFTFIGFDGSKGMGWSKTLIKVQCNNTYTAALREEGVTSFRQTKNRLTRVDAKLQVQNPNVLAARYHAEIKADSELFQHLATVPANSTIHNAFVNAMFPASKENDDKTPKLTPAIVAQREAFEDALTSTPGASSTAGTLAGLYDALTTLETHAPNMRKDTNPISRDVLSGLSEQRRNNALKILTGWAN